MAYSYNNNNTMKRLEVAGSIVIDITVLAGKLPQIQNSGFFGRSSLRVLTSDSIFNLKKNFTVLSMIVEDK